MRLLAVGLALLRRAEPLVEHVLAFGERWGASGSLQAPHPSSAAAQAERAGLRRSVVRLGDLADVAPEARNVTVLAPVAEPDLGQPDPAQAEAVEEPVPDYPVAVRPTSPAWAELQDHAQQALLAINDRRNASNLTEILPNDWNVEYGWTLLQAELGFKACVRAMVDGEETWLTVDTSDVDGEVAVEAVTPDSVLGAPTLAQLARRLQAAGRFQETSSQAADFPCSADAARAFEQTTCAVEAQPMGLLATRSPMPGKRRLALAQNSTLPASYNTREAFPDCAFEVLNQGSCGSCYAFAAAAMAGERRCIAARQSNRTNATNQTRPSFLARTPGEKWPFLLHQRAVADPLSQQDLVSCGGAQRQEYETPWCLRGPNGEEIRRYTNACDGATNFNTLMYLHLKGLPTRECIPYTAGGNGRHEDHFDIEGEKVDLCAALEGEACHLNRAQNTLGLPRSCPAGDVACIQDAILRGGPVYASMMSTSGFHAAYGSDPEGAYTDGVYAKQAGEWDEGGHAVVLFGWGTGPSGIDYWWGRNSWGDQWALGGLFKIQRGVDMVGIEGDVVFSETNTSDSRHLDGDCLKVTLAPGRCTIKNTCDLSVRTGRVAYYGTSSDCGTWSLTLPRLNPQAETEIEGWYCAIEEDSELEPYDPSTFYKDVTETVRGWGYTTDCAVENTYAGDGLRRLCCGGASGSTCYYVEPGGVALMPLEACSADACAQTGGSLYEDTVPA